MTRRRSATRLRAPDEAMIAVADAGYQLASDDVTWLRGVLEAARPLLDHGSFVHGWIVDLKVPEFRAFTAVSLPPGADALLHARDQHPVPAAPDVSGLLDNHLISASQFYGREDLARKAHFPPGFDLIDAIALTARDPTGICCALMGALPDFGVVDARSQARWSRVASHLAAGLRLRERLRASPGEASLDAADALLTPKGRVVHASADAESHLDAIRAGAEVLAARHGDVDPARLLAAWRALVAGRWSLVDSFDTDHKRFFVLRRNPPDAPGMPRLDASARAIAAYVAMGHSNKAIAYHLGVAESTVTRAVARVCAALGVPDRASLARLGATLQAHPGVDS